MQWSNLFDHDKCHMDRYDTMIYVLPCMKKYIECIILHSHESSTPIHSSRVRIAIMY
jgi:hypothetical protein